MKIRAYIRVGKLKKGGYKFSMTKNSMNNCLYGDYYSYNSRALPTISFGIDFDIPDEVFNSQLNPITKINLDLKDIKIPGKIMKQEIEKAITKAKIIQIKQ